MDKFIYAIFLCVILYFAYKHHDTGSKKACQLVEITCNDVKW